MNLDVGWRYATHSHTEGVETQWEGRASTIPLGVVASQLLLAISTGTFFFCFRATQYRRSLISI